MARAIVFIAGMVILIAVDILRVYFIMPFPGSQRGETLKLAYFLHRYIALFRIAGLLVIVVPLIYFLRSGSKKAKWRVAISLLVFAGVFYQFNFRFLADKMFYQPKHKIFADAASNSVPENSLELGVSVDGESKAYPIEIIGYHHQVRDTIGNTPAMITYCTVCPIRACFQPHHRWSAGDLSPGWDGSFQCHVRRRGDEELVATGER